MRSNGKSPVPLKKPQSTSPSPMVRAGTKAPALPEIFQGEWQLVYDGVRSELLEHYAHHGPAYRVICEILASAYTYTKKAEQEGRVDILMKEYVRALELIRGLLDQMQKYTESRKAEIQFGLANDVAAEVAQILAAEFSDQPQRVTRALKAVQTRLEAGV